MGIIGNRDSDNAAKFRMDAGGTQSGQPSRVRATGHVRHGVGRHVGRWLGVLVCLVVTASPVAGATESPTAPPGMANGGEATVTDIVDGDTVWLDTGVQVRLTGIQAPKLALGRVGFEDWPLADDAKRALTDLALGRQVTLLFDGQREDRHGRILAHLVRDDDVWLQGAMVAAGMARAYSFADNRIAASVLLAIEAQAQGGRLGIWAHPYYAIRRPEQTDTLIDSFQIVEGRVQAADRVRNRVYLNFGTNWRDDFTVSVATRDVDVFTAAGIDLLDLEGRTVRVRGWLNRRNGPMIEIDHPEQIEIVEDR